jgi:hypothetical protein
MQRAKGVEEAAARFFFSAEILRPCGRRVDAAGTSPQVPAKVAVVPEEARDSRALC